jgi:glycosyltransferase involved in cell wall biosynthesis
MKTPRVVHVTPALFGDRGAFGGGERYAYELARAMSSSVPTTLLSFGPSDISEQAGDLAIRVLDRTHYVRGQRENPISWRLVPELLKADVIHCHQQHIVASSVAAAVARVARRKVFVSDLGGGGWDISGYVSTDRWYDGHLHISEYSRRIAGHADDPRAHVIYGGVDVEKFSPAPNLRREPAVLFVGRLLPHKGIDILIRALPVGVPLWIVGAEASPEYVTALRSLACGKSVEFLGNLPDEAIVDRYRRASCIVLPSVYRTMYGRESKVPELLGQTLLEGMSCGTPALCSDVASMPEIVVHGETGFVFPEHGVEALRERIVELTTQPQLVQGLGQRARERVLTLFTWERVVRHCLEIYERSAI